jgi:sigma-B regulation protein RsbU (phosphoserine phosphatase)
VNREDFKDNPRIQTLLAMLRDLSTARNPLQALQAWARGYWPLHPVDLMLSLSTRDLPPGHYRITRQIDVAAVLDGRQVPIPSEPWRNRDAIPVHSGGFLGDLIADGRPKLLTRFRLDDDPVLGDALRGMGSGTIVPMFHEGHPVYWSLVFKRDPDAFAPADVERSLIVANLVGGNNTRLLLVNEVNRLNARLTDQLEDVARVQRSLLPKRLPDIPRLQIATSYLTSDQAGGDYYDFFRFADGTWGILIADVAGHGPAAATIMAMLHGILHAYVGAPRGTTPDDVMRYANSRLVDADIEGSFVTAFFAVYDPAAARITYARSGHNPPLLKDGRTGAVRHLDGAGALPLGVLEPYDIHSETVELRPQDTLVLYTDGITEAFNHAGEMFGPQRLDEALTACSGDPDCAVDSVHGSLFRHTGSRTRADDQTLVAIRFRG